MKLDLKIFFVHFLIIAMGMINSPELKAQFPDELEDPLVNSTFTSPQLINVQTIETIPLNGFEFRIQHRFGTIAFDKSIYKEFLGLDLMANIRLGVAFPVTKNFMLGGGRSKAGKTWDLEGKYLLLRQRTDNKMPVSFALYSSAAFNSDDFPSVPENSYFSDSTTPFKYKFSHRLSYSYQAMVSRKFANKFSLQAGFLFIWRNLASAGQDNFTLALPLAARLKLGMDFALVAEYGFILNNKPQNRLNPVSVGVEFGTVGHAFRFFASSNQFILDQQLYNNPSGDYTKSKFLFGFNITRTFWRKKEKG